MAKLTAFDKQMRVLDHPHRGREKLTGGKVPPPSAAAVSFIANAILPSPPVSHTKESRSSRYRLSWHGPMLLVLSRAFPELEPAAKEGGRSPFPSARCAAPPETEELLRSRRPRHGSVFVTGSRRARCADRGSLCSCATVGVGASRWRGAKELCDPLHLAAGRTRRTLHPPDPPNRGHTEMLFRIRHRLVQRRASATSSVTNEASAGGP
jgi:hypothetical protein